jgi:hypothetical protein
MHQNWIIFKQNFLEILTNKKERKKKNTLWKYLTKKHNIQKEIPETIKFLLGTWWEICCVWICVGCLRSNKERWQRVWFGTSLQHECYLPSTHMIGSFDSLRAVRLYSFFSSSAACKGWEACIGTLLRFDIAYCKLNWVLMYDIIEIYEQSNWEL